RLLDAHEVGSALLEEGAEALRGDGAQPVDVPGDDPHRTAARRLDALARSAQARRSPAGADGPARARVARAREALGPGGEVRGAAVAERDRVAERAGSDALVARPEARARVAERAARGLGVRRFAIRDDEVLAARRDRVGVGP